MARDKLRIRFRKMGDLRLVSHHDLMRCLERMLRRAGLPFRSTQGFNPKPKMAFALSLALGIEGCDEVVELELEEVIAIEEITDRLTRQAPGGLEIVSVQRVDPRTKAQVQRVCYRVGLPAARRAETAERATRLLGESQCWVERTRPQPRRLDVRPYLRDLRVDGNELEMDLWVTPTGTARPDDVLGLLGLGDLPGLGAVIRRTVLELHESPSPCPLARRASEECPSLARRANGQGEGEGLPTESGMETEAPAAVSPPAAE
jgi:radical SAM-linked protein